MKTFLKISAVVAFVLAPFALPGCRAIERVMHLFRLVPLALIGGCLCVGLMCGCQVTTHNQAEVGFRWGTEFTLFSRSAQTAPEPATIKSEAPALIEWLFPKKVEQPPPVVVVEPTPEPNQ